METHFKEALEFFLECLGVFFLVAGICSWILYKIFVIDFVKKEQKDATMKKSETQFIDQLLQQ